MCEGEKNFLHQPDISAGAPENPVSEISTSDGIALVFNETDKEKPHYFEKINLLSGIDENKLEELQQADLVLVYRDNNRYKAMSDALKDLVEQKYGGKVYCVSIPQGTEKLDDKEMELLKNILNTCHCMTDNTIEYRTGTKCSKFEDYEKKYENSKRFLWIIENLRKSIEDNRIDTVYVYISGITEEGKVCNSYSDHGSMYQREDGSIYFDPYNNWNINEKTDIKINNFKIFWEKAFPNSDVKFIEKCPINRKFEILDFSKCKTEGVVIVKTSGKRIPNKVVEDIIKKQFPDLDFDINFYIGGILNDSNGYKSDGAVLIADRHVSNDVESFGGQKIFYAGNTFEPDGGIKNFVSDEVFNYVRDAAVDNLAESIILNIHTKKTTEVKKINKK